MIQGFDFGNGDIAFYTELLVPPLDPVWFVAPDTSDDSRALLTEWIRDSKRLWPEVLGQLQQQIEDWEVDQALGRDEFLVSISRMDEDDFMGDQSDIHLRLEFEDPPLWDYYLRDGKIVHVQPVF